jgi:hypothetical protein
MELLVFWSKTNGITFLLSINGNSVADAPMTMPRLPDCLDNNGKMSFPNFYNYMRGIPLTKQLLYLVFVTL